MVFQQYVLKNHKYRLFPFILKSKNTFICSWKLGGGEEIIYIFLHYKCDMKKIWGEFLEEKEQKRPW